MKKIAYVVPYYGKLPENFEFWLIGCEKNPTIDWIIFTDDKTHYKYPENVKVFYTTFKELKDRIQGIYDFKISLERPYKLCDFKVAYGEIFEKELKGYDFWGHCDLDMIFGNIRKFITDEILDAYDKIGNQGHSTIYRNNKEVNGRYRKNIDGIIGYKEILSTDKSYAFDENIICDMYDKMNIKYYKKTIYAHLNKYEPSFYLGHLNKEDICKNKRQIFQWKDGVINRYYVIDNKLYREEFMYIHFWCRPINYKVKEFAANHSYIIYPDIVKRYDKDIGIGLVKKYGHQSKLKFILKMLYFNRKKITLERIKFNIKSFCRYRKRDIK